MRGSALRGRQWFACPGRRFLPSHVSRVFNLSSIEIGHIPPVTSMTLPVRSGTSVAGLKWDFFTMARRSRSGTTRWTPKLIAKTPSSTKRARMLDSMDIGDAIGLFINRVESTSHGW